MDSTTLMLRRGLGIWLLAVSFLVAASQPALPAVILHPMVMKIDSVNDHMINVFDAQGPGGLLQPVEHIVVGLRAAAAGTFASPGAAIPSHLELVNDSAPAADENIGLKLWYDGNVNSFPNTGFFDVSFDFTSAANAHGVFTNVGGIPIFPNLIFGVTTALAVTYSSPDPLDDFFYHQILAQAQPGFSIGSVDKVLAGANDASFLDLVYNVTHTGSIFPLLGGLSPLGTIPIDLDNPIINSTLGILSNPREIPEPAGLTLALLGMTTLAICGRRWRAFGGGKPLRVPRAAQQIE
jgi:hypothetical protein